MKIAIINDQHFGVRGDNSYFLDKQEKFYKELFFPTIEAEGVDTVLDLGDTFDRRKYVNFVTLRRSQKMYFDPLQERGIKLHSIVGNHNTYYKNTNEVNSLNLLLDKYDNINIYESDPVELKFGGLKIMMVPWICSQNIDVCMDGINSTDATFLMGHFEIRGFEMMAGRLCDHGLDKEMFARFDSVYSGHFHHPSEYQNIKYLGAPYEMTWSDYGGKRGFHILDTETLELQHIQNPHVMFHKLYYNDIDDNLTIEDVATIDTSDYVGAYVKIVVEAKTNPYVFDLMIDALQQAGVADIKVVESALNFETIDDDELLDEAQDTLTIMETYIDNLSVAANKDRLKQMMRDLYQDAMSL